MGILNAFSKKQRYINIAKILEKKAREESIQKAGKEFGGSLSHLLVSKNLARQFVLEEIDQIKHTDSNFVIDFIKNSGFSPIKYVGATRQYKNNDDKVILKQIQEIVGNVTYYFNDKGLMTLVYISMIDFIMQEWGLGKYGSGINDNQASVEKSNDTMFGNDVDRQEFVQLLIEFNNIQQDEETIEALRFSAAEIPISALDHDKVQKAHKVMHKLSELTGQTLEELFVNGGLIRIIDKMQAREE